MSSLDILASALAANITRQDLCRKVVADLGCGFGKWGHLIRSWADVGGNTAYLIGCDIYKPYLLTIKKYNHYDELICCDIRKLPFKKDTIRTCIVFEVLEHLSKSSGRQLLKQLEIICKGKILIFTPINYPQEAIRDNSFEKHESFRTLSEFERMGFSAYTFGYGHNFEWWTRKINKIFAFLSKRLPPFAFLCYVIAVKRICQNKRKDMHKSGHRNASNALAV